MPDSPIIITAALLPEAATLIRRLILHHVQAPHDHLQFEGTFHNHRITLLITGMGTARATQALHQAIHAIHPQRIFITGFAGAIDPQLKTANLFTASPILTTAGQHWTCPDPIGAAPLRPLLTVDHVVSTPAEKAELFRRYHAAAVDMESAALAKLCDQSQIPWECIRVISDRADESVPDFAATLIDPLGRPLTSKAIRYTLTHPHHLLRLLHLARTSKRCAATLADHITPLLQSLTT